MKVFDLSRPLGPQTEVFPGDPPVTVTRVAGYESEGYEVSRVCLGTHAGTHIEAPRHFFAEGLPLSSYPLERLMGPSLVIDLRPAPEPGTTPQHEIHPGCEARRHPAQPRAGDAWLDDARLAAALRSSPLHALERVLLWTGGHGFLSPAGARLLLAAGAGLVAIDSPSLDPEPGRMLPAPGQGGDDPGDNPADHPRDYPVHRLLLGADVLLAEELTGLETIGAGQVQCAFLPLPLAHTDAAPARVIAWR